MDIRFGTIAVDQIKANVPFKLDPEIARKYKVPKATVFVPTEAGGLYSIGSYLSKGPGCAFFVDGDDYDAKGNLKGGGMLQLAVSDDLKEVTGLSPMTEPFQPRKVLNGLKMAALFPMRHARPF